MTWLREAGRRGWAVLMKDERIRYRSVERDALAAGAVQAFCLANGNLRAETMAEQFLDVVDAMAARCQMPGPFLYVVSSQGLRSVAL